ncbi:MAG: DnaB-like helicase C-terminal domain-containing protein [Fusobacteriaceae bacterium]
MRPLLITNIVEVYQESIKKGVECEKIKDLEFEFRLEPLKAIKKLAFCLEKKEQEEKVRKIFINSELLFLQKKDIVKPEMHEQVKDLATCEEIPIEEINWGNSMMDFLFGGLRFGELTCIFGESGSGKTTFALQLIADLTESSQKIMLWSSELSTQEIKNTLFKQLTCNSYNLNVFKNPRNDRTDSTVKPEIISKIKESIKGQVLVYDTDISCTEQNILKRMAELNDDFGVRIFVIDSLMNVECSTTQANYLLENKAVLQKIRVFSKERKCHVIVINHQIKSNGKKLKEINQFDMQGSSNIPNLCNNILFIASTQDETNTTFLKVCKGRKYGKSFEKYVKFNKVNERFYEDAGQKFKEYKWEREETASRKK